VRHGDWIVAAGVHKLIPGQIVRPYEGGPTSALTPGSAPTSGRAETDGAATSVVKALTARS